MKKKYALLLAGLVLACGVFVTALPAVANMLIMPVRVYFADGERMKSLTVLNRGEEQAVFRVVMQHKKQLPDGGYENLSAPLVAGFDPSQWLVYSPRQVNLEGQSKQSVRVSLRRPADLPDGEYRVHMALDRTARERIEARTGEAGKITPQMFINVGFAIPVIIRKGKNDTVAEIKGYSILPPDAQGGDTRGRLMVDLSRRGKFGAVGELTAFWTPPGGGEEVLAGQQKGVIIYPELDARTIRIYLNTPIQGGKLRIVYSGIEVDRGKVFDEKTFTL